MPIQNSIANIQIGLAAMGCISGTLAEWPHLKTALRAKGYNLPDTMPAIELVNLCRDIKANGGLSND